MEGDLYKEIKNLNVESLARKESLGIEASFEEIVPHARDLATFLKEGVEAIEIETGIPEGLVTNFRDIARTFADRINEILAYSPGRYQNDAATQRKKVIDKFIEYHELVVTGKDTFGLLTTVNMLKSYKEKRLTTVLRDAESSKKGLDKIVANTKELVDTLRSEVGKKGVSDYAEIFHKEAHRYSGYRVEMNKPKNNFKWANVFDIIVGNSIIWFSIGGLILIFGIAFALHHDELFSITSTNPKEFVPEIIRWVFFTSIWLFAFRFCFKQYSINKHLFTLNKHRENTLNSFRLLMESVNPDDVATRSAIVLEVTKAIYEHGHTGYLTDNSSEVQSPSVIEISKYLTGNKS